MTGPQASPEKAEQLSGKYLTLFLAEEEYGIAILKVQEIIGMMNVTIVPRTAPFIRGVINLRGKIIPIVCLRLRFGMQAIPQTAETCIIVVRTRDMEIGLIVDRVSEVLDVKPEDIDEAPNLGADVKTDYFMGIAKSGGRAKLLLDIDKVLSTVDGSPLGGGV